MSIIRLKACLNGSRRRDEHPAIPITPADLAVAAKAAVEAGADAIHIHPRRADGRESLAAGDIAAAVRAIREAGPRVPVGVSTGLWMTGGDVARRYELITAWAGIDAAASPDFASVNVKEPGFAAVADLLQASGIDVEPGIWSAADAETLAGVVPRRPWIRLLVEIMDATPERAPAMADAVLDRLDALRVDGPRLLHGNDTSCWPLVARAGLLGLATRIGLEDTLTVPAGGGAADNADLVHVARRLLERAGAIA